MTYSRKKGSRSRSKSSGKSEDVYLAGWDTEDDGKGNATLFTLVHERGSFWSRDSAAFMDKLLSLSKHLKLEGKTLQLWATNLEYDIVNLFGVDSIRQVRLNFGRSYLISALWEGILFLDTVRHLPASVETLGELVGLPKMVRDTSVEYGLRDATITFRFALELSKIYMGLRVYTRSTLASTGYHLWADRYFDRPVRQVPDEIRSVAREAYHGGRTEAFAIGDFKDVSVIDVSSMFPWAMVAGPFPIPWQEVRKSNDLTPLGIYRTEIESKISLPALPVRTRTGTIYPNGTWTGWYVGAEVAYAQSQGVRVRVLEGYEFGEFCKPFDSYVKKLFELKAKSRGCLRSIYKTLLNSLYGKFGQGGHRIVCTPLAKWEQNGRKHEDKARVWNGLVLYPVDAPAPPWGNNIWAALVTARARCHLHREMVRISRAGGRILYADTDSIFYQGADSLRFPRRVSRPGDFERRGRFRNCIIRGKKEYGLEVRPGEWEFHVKGIPAQERETYVRSGIAQFLRPTRLRESVRTGKSANIWETRIKRRRVSFHDRTLSAEGFLTPIEIRNGEVVSKAEETEE